MTTLEDRKINLALSLMDIGASQFEPKPLKKHETDPNARLSPVFFNLRTPENPKPGRLTPELVMTMAQLMEMRLLEEDLEYHRIAGLPHAGTPIAERLHRLLKTDHPELGLMTLIKTQVDGKRSISGVEGGEYEAGDGVLLVDDLVTEAHSKLEAINALGSAGLIVTDIIVLIDREQGGKEQLLDKGYALYSVFTMTELVNIYLEHKCITSEKRDEVIAYITAERAAVLAA